MALRLPDFLHPLVLLVAVTSPLQVKELQGIGKAPPRGTLCMNAGTGPAPRVRAQGRQERGRWREAWGCEGAVPTMGTRQNQATRD